MKRKGFTLIELLAVIVILAIIALIATPIVINVIENTRKGAAERSVENYIDAVETAIASSRLDNEILEGTYVINLDGNLCPVSEGINCEKPTMIEMNGNKPQSGEIQISMGNVSIYSYLNGYCITTNYENGAKEVIKKKNKEACYGILPSEYQEVEYLESTGTQYIDTGYLPNPTTVLNIELSFHGDFNANGTKTFLGSKDGDNVFTLSFGSTATESNHIVIWSDKSYAAGGVAGHMHIDDNIRTNRNMLSFKSGSATYIKAKYESDIKTTSHNVPLALFGRNENGTITAFNAYNMRIYSVKIYDNNKLDRNLVPVYRKSDNVRGMYDLVNGDFYVNAANNTIDFNIDGNI